MESVAVNAAAAFGVNETFKFVAKPGSSDTGSAGEVKAKYLVETDAPLMVTVLFPELVMVRTRLLLVLGLTLPKSRLAVPRTKFPLCWLELVPPPDSLNP